LTVAEASLAEAMERLGVLLARQGAGAGLVADLRIDSLLMPAAATLALVEQIEDAGPFGAQAPAPRFAFAAQRIVTRRIGTGHLKFSFGEAEGQRIEGMAFGAFDGPLGLALEGAGHRLVHLAGKLDLNTWGGKTRVQFRLDDAAWA
jgi:single-stranded-DNA-specific exonuclease